jgi:hypothetical protein
MEINLKSLSTQVTESTTTARKMRLSENATSMVFQLFTKNIYSNPIGTVVREITSNCFDSHVEAGVNSPVLIKKTVDKQEGTTYISFIDYGVGMSPERVYDIYGVYFESTKRVDNTQIGGFGIGGKTPLAYKRSTGHGEGEYDNTFYVITKYNGTCYYYCIYEGLEAPEISLLHSEPTTDHNGTEIRVPVLEADVYNFEKEMVRQLYYFENVIFENFDRQTLTNQYSIVRSKTFLFRGTEYSDVMHVCLGRVAYPIDYNVLGLSASDYRLPVAVRLEVGEIGVVASREQLDYSEKTIKTLKKKLEAVKKEIKEMFSKQYSDTTTLEDYFQMKHEFGMLKFPNGTGFKVPNSIIGMKDINFSNFKYNSIKVPDDEQLFSFFFNSRRYGNKSRSKYSDDHFNGGYMQLQRQSNMFSINGEFNRKIVKQAWLKETYGTYFLIYKRNLLHDYKVRSEIADLFNMSLDKLVDDKGKPVPYVQTLLDMQDDYFDIVRRYAPDYNTLEVPADFIEHRKNRKIISKEMREIEITARFVGGRYGKSNVKLDKLFKFNMPIFYGTQDDEYALSKASSMYSALFDEDSIVRYYSNYDKKFETGDSDKKYKKGIMFLQLAKNNIKYMEYCKKAWHVSEFFWRMLYRKENDVMTYFQTYDIVKSWENISSFYRDNSFSKIDSKWGRKIKEVNAFINKLPGNENNSIGHLKHQLSDYFNLNDLKKTGEQQRIEKLIEEIRELAVVNEDTMQYINLPYRDEKKDEALIAILKKVMTL